jgi:predicted anti-sigma-YlaC factor YlaD
MNCSDIQLSVSTYIDEEAGAAPQEVMFAHLATCKQCRAFLGATLALRRRLAASPVPEVPPSLDRRVMQMRPARPRSVRRMGQRLRLIWSRRLSVPLPSVALVALALITITVLSLSLWQRPEVVCVPCLPAVDVYAEQPAGSINSK